MNAICVDGDGYRRILGVCEGHKEDKAVWLGFPQAFKGSRPTGVRLVISDACLGLAESVAELYPDADWQRCVVRFSRNVFSHAPHTKMREVAAMLKSIHSQEDREATQQNAEQVIDKLEAIKLSAAV